MPIIRPATAADLPAIDAVHRAAFPTDVEARLVALLIAHGQDRASLVAEERGPIVGHVLFSPVDVGDAEDNRPSGLGLAPVAVLPDWQRCGIGAALILAGLDACRSLDAPFVVVLGEPAYYSRFGFEAASRYNLTCEFGGGDAFQVLVLRERSAPADGGLVRYAPEFRAIVGSSE